MERGRTASSLLSFGLFAGCCCCRSSPCFDESVVMIALCAEVQKYSRTEIAKPSGTRSYNFSLKSICCIFPKRRGWIVLDKQVLTRPGSTTRPSTQMRAGKLRSSNFQPDSTETSSNELIPLPTSNLLQQRVGIKLPRLGPTKSNQLFCLNVRLYFSCWFWPRQDTVVIKSPPLQICNGTFMTPIH